MRPGVLGNVQGKRRLKRDREPGGAALAVYVCAAARAPGRARGGPADARHGWRARACNHGWVLRTCSVGLSRGPF